MGIPKFYRYIAQRWPLTSQVVNDNVIPEFDNLYLDMNSIIHMCSHANSTHVGHLDQNKVFQDICNYLEHLFSIIEPKKVFYMAIDGVAPRAKMNQQRSRRFRSAQEAEENREKAIKEGIDLEEDPFDSNCITPGTEFMHNLSTFLRYFIALKLSNDSKWQKCRIVLSGSDVPGEGEHKIMRFIRNLRSDPTYDPNTRHCLYGLDADLIMLGLSTHEPHFSLLREEVLFTKQAQNKSTELNDQRFNLLHMSLIRDYMEIELSDPDFKVQPDFERMLDDFILVCFFVGNDFLPVTPMLMIEEDAIPVIFNAYKRYLKESNNQYLSENGIINFKALKGWLKHIMSFQIDKFEEKSLDPEWFDDQMRRISHSSGVDSNIELTKHEFEVFNEIRPFMQRCLRKADTVSTMTISEDQKFVKLVADMVGFEFQDNVLRLANAEIDAEEARKQIRMFNSAHVKAGEEDHKAYSEKFDQWRNRYYVRKFGDNFESDVVKNAAKRYLEGLQWVLFYYYRGCHSWSWYYNNHYAPMTPEIISIIAESGDDFNPTFELGQPFTPFEQLMAVLPDRSSALLPPALRPLVLEDNSPLRDFYPHDFALDRNDRKALWEAIVLIPFIDVNRLLKYVQPIEQSMLTPEEQLRNAMGPELIFDYAPGFNFVFPAPNERVSKIDNCKCVWNVLPTDCGSVTYGLLPNAAKGVHALAGFPSLHTLKFTETLERDFGVKIFEFPSRGASIIVHVAPVSEDIKAGERVYINWPYLHEAKVAEVRTAANLNFFDAVVRDFTFKFKRLGTDLGKTDAVIGVHELKGLQRMPDGSYKKDYDSRTVFVPAQLVVKRVEKEDQRFIEREAVPMSQEFAIGTYSLALLPKFYGLPAKILNVSDSDNQADIEITGPLETGDPIGQAANMVIRKDLSGNKWFSSHEAASKLKLTENQLHRLTSRLILKDDKSEYNATLSICKRNQNLVAEGYTRLNARKQCFFSEKAVELVSVYLRKFAQQFSKIKKGDMNVSTETGKEMRDWVRSKLNDLKFVDGSTARISTKATKEIEMLAGNSGTLKLSSVVIKGVDRGALLSAKSGFHQLRTQSFKLGDRVVSVPDSGKVPLFCRGVVVGVNASTLPTLDIVWDYEFPAAGDLDGRCSAKRGLCVPEDTVLNVGDMQLIYRREPIVNRVDARVNTKTTKRGPRKNTADFVPAPKHEKISFSQKPQLAQTQPAQTPAQPAKKGNGLKPKTRGKNKTNKPEPKVGDLSLNDTKVDHKGSAALKNLLNPEK